MVERAYGAERVPVGEDWCSELGHGRHALPVIAMGMAVADAAPPPGA
ncbi:hypothetical protein OHR86_00485 [Streptomyces sp. NBC_00441]|nr:hypothetical protein [Streptomyces sp. NBC_00441]